MYLAIIMAISLSFSFTLYKLSMREFDRGFRRQDELVSRLPPTEFLPRSFLRQIAASRETAAKEAQERILSELLLANVAIFVLGGGLSYFLARRTLEPIEQAHTSLEQFTADASHELRTPIAAMKSEIEVALLQPKLTTSEAKQVLVSSLEELDRLTELTAGLLSIARLEDNPVDLKAHQLEPIITSAISKVEVLAKQKNVTFATEISNKKLSCIANRQSLLEVLVILLDNAVKYSHANSVVEVKTRKTKDVVEVSVIDYGIGISPEDLPRVFDRFYRVDTSRSQQNSKGHGLGLAIAKQLIERQNGTIKITSQHNQSTKVTVCLKIKSEARI
jgi:two-component system sensor histidine kinase CiaH